MTSAFVFLMKVKLKAQWIPDLFLPEWSWLQYMCCLQQKQEEILQRIFYQQMQPCIHHNCPEHHNNFIRIIYRWNNHIFIMDIGPCLDSTFYYWSIRVTWETSMKFGTKNWFKVCQMQLQQMSFFQQSTRNENKAHLFVRSHFYCFIFNPI